MKQISPLKKHIDESPKLRELKRKRHRLRMRLLTLFGILFLALVGGFIYFARYPKFQIRDVTVSGNQIADTSDVITHVDSFLAGNYFYVVPHRNSFFYPKQKMIAGLAAAFPRFSTISIYRTNLTTILVSVTEIRGKALWCGTDITPAGESDPCYFTDGTGKIVAQAPLYSGDVYPRFFGGSIDANDPNPIGKTFISPASFQNLLDFNAAVTALGFQVKAIDLGTASDEDQFVLDLGGGNTAIVRFLDDADYSVLAGNLSAAIGQPKLAGQLKTDEKNLQYFDLRFTNKVYYKFSDQ